MKKKWISLLLALTMCLGLLPATAFAGGGTPEDLDLPDAADITTETYSWDSQGRILVLKGGTFGTVTLPDRYLITVETAADSTVGKIEFRKPSSQGYSYEGRILFRGAGTLTVQEQLHQSYATEIIVAQGAQVALENGINVGTSGGSDSSIRVDGTMTAKAGKWRTAILAGRMMIGGTGRVSVQGVHGIKLVGGSTDYGIGKRLTVKAGGALEADCTESCLELFTGSYMPEKDQIGIVLDIPENYLPETHRVVLLTEGLEYPRYTLTVAGPDQNPEVESESVSGAGGKLLIGVQPEKEEDNGPITPVGPRPRLYDIAVTEAENGQVKADHDSALAGETVRLTVAPDAGFRLSALTVLDENGGAVELTEGENTFRMPASPVTVEAKFAPAVTFADVPADSYFAQAVEWAAAKGVTSGVDALHFAPDAVCTRAQAVTFLWRAAGSPAPKTAASAFTDVVPGSYYETAVLWAVENGVTLGTSETTFGPEETCTRAQIVTFLWRAQKMPAAAPAAFADVAADAYYAGAVAWAVEQGVTLGTSADTFSPGADCTRAEIVTFLFRCLGK